MNRILITLVRLLGGGSKSSIDVSTINFFIENLNVKTLKSMKIKKVIAKDGGQINIADKINTVNHNSIQIDQLSKDEVKQVLHFLKSVDHEKLKEINQEIVRIENKDLPASQKMALKDWLLSSMHKHGIPISQSISAAAIYELLRVVFLG